MIADNLIHKFLRLFKKVTILPIAKDLTADSSSVYIFLAVLIKKTYIAKKTITTQNINTMFLIRVSEIPTAPEKPRKCRSGGRRDSRRDILSGRCDTGGTIFVFSS